MVNIENTRFDVKVDDLVDDIMKSVSDSRCETNASIKEFQKVFGVEHLHGLPNQEKLIEEQTIAKTESGRLDIEISKQIRDIKLAFQNLADMIHDKQEQDNMVCCIEGQYNIGNFKSMYKTEIM